jgi:hypothetical protein
LPIEKSNERRAIKMTVLEDIFQKKAGRLCGAAGGLSIVRDRAATSRYVGAI